MEQLTLDLTPKHASSYEVSCIKNGELLFSVPVDSYAGALTKRRSLVELFQRSPYHGVQWDYDSRPTGWFGLRPDPRGASVYVLTVTPSTRS